METYGGYAAVRVTEPELIVKDLDTELTHPEAAPLLRLAAHSTHGSHTF